MNHCKMQLTERLLAAPASVSEAELGEYKEQFPYDTDSYIMEAVYWLSKGAFARVRELLSEGERLAYYNTDIQYLWGELHFAEKDYAKAMAAYSKALVFHELLSDEYGIYHSEDCMRRLQAVELALGGLETVTRELFSELDEINERLQNKFDLSETIVGNGTECIGKFFQSPFAHARYCAYALPTQGYIFHSLSPKTLLMIRGEFLKLIDAECTHKAYSLPVTEPVLLPIASVKRENEITFQAGEGSPVTVRQDDDMHFGYYRLEESTKLWAKDPVVIGEPVRLVHAENRKKVVISFFVDGLSQQLIREEGLEKVMPNTWRFFSKGMICENFFTASDWTYPSVASFVSGANPLQHMMVHPEVNKKLPEDSKLLFEYLKEQGYYTAMFNGDWRSSAEYGYDRGIDRYVVQNAVYYRNSQVINDVLEHLQAFRDTDQYIWLTTAELHDIADEYELSLPIQTSLSIREQEAQPKSATSVKQSYSPSKRAAYIQALKENDTAFQVLYDYLERNYSDDEFVVTLFGDHGQTYLLRPEQHHLARYHSNVAFMVRGGVKQGVTEEYMSAVDYPHILSRLAGMKEEITTPDGRLPAVFGGEGERAYTITETVHPGDPYMASIHAKDHTFYFTTEEPLSWNCRLDFSDFHTELRDANDSLFEDAALERQYVEMIYERLRYIRSY